MHLRSQDSNMSLIIAGSRLQACRLAPLSKRMGKATRLLGVAEPPLPMGGGLSVSILSLLRRVRGNVSLTPRSPSVADFVTQIHLSVTSAPVRPRGDGA
eukprot:1276179-Pleurochrysis_carterae.AAC.3